MVRFVENPNIPDGNVRTVLLGSRYAGLLDKPLAVHGVHVIPVSEGEGLDPRVAQHADMLAHHLGGSEWIACKSAELALKSVENIVIYPLDVSFSKEYPGDVPLNLLRLGNHVYGRTDAASPLLLEHLSNKGVEQVRVKQGYAKCSVCVVSRWAAITSDAGLAAAMRQCGVDVLEIDGSGIRLDGYDAGFIGGATGLIAPNKLAFTGRLDSLADGSRIREFIHRHGVQPVELLDTEMFDVGSMLPVTEEI